MIKYSTSQLGEAAAKIFFETKGYKILEEHYQERLKDLVKDQKNEEDMYRELSCTSKKRPDNGIDGIFIPNGYAIENSPIIVINEAKFRNKPSLSPSDFGFVKKGDKYAHNVQQAHSYWNRDRFDEINCVGDLKYANREVIRTATHLNGEGLLTLYEVKDKYENQHGNTLDQGFPSTWHGNKDAKKAFNALFN